jgi:hypothetical protein
MKAETALAGLGCIHLFKHAQASGKPDPLIEAAAMCAQWRGNHTFIVAADFGEDRREWRNFGEPASASPFQAARKVASRSCV